MRTRLPYPALLFLSLGLIVANGFLVAYAMKPAEEPALTVSFLDVGQGDAILIEGPTGIQMLVDGGKGRDVLRELPSVMGPLDRTLDIVLATHPDADHIGGLPDVLARYRVAHLIGTGRDAGSSVAARFEEAARTEEGAVGTRALEGMRIHLGDGAYADMLHPEGNVSKISDVNDTSIVLRIVYGETSFMLTGDAAVWVEERLVERYGEALRSDVLKAGHHGSKTSTGAKFVETVAPEVVVISAGADNSYGHPHTDVVATIRASGAAMAATYEEGTITFVSDGTTVSRE